MPNTMRLGKVSPHSHELTKMVELSSLWTSRKSCPIFPKIMQRKLTNLLWMIKPGEKSLGELYFIDIIFDLRCFIFNNVYERLNVVIMIVGSRGMFVL